MKEYWKNVTGYEKYQVSSCGKVRNKDGKILKPLIKRGYEYVALSKNNEAKHFAIHRLVALMFLDNPSKKPYVDHLNTIVNDNRVQNLRWCTQKENCNNPITRQHNSMSSTGVSMDDATKQKISKSLSGKYGNRIVQISTDGLITHWPSACYAATILNLRHKSIIRCLKGERRTYKGFRWEYSK